MLTHRLALVGEVLYRIHNGWEIIMIWFLKNMIKIAVRKQFCVYSVQK
jgi:hypothetical protein